MPRLRMKWAIVIEKSANGYGGYAPDFPGLSVGGDSLTEQAVEYVEL